MFCNCFIDKRLSLFVRDVLFNKKIAAETPFLSLFAFNLLIDNGTNDISYHIVLLDEDERPWQVL